MNKTRYLTQAAIIAALYAVLTHMQNLLLPGTTTWAIQMRISEAMNVLAFFTPAAIPGLSLGCLVFNLTYAGTLPLDFLVGTLATFLAALAMWKTRNVKIGKLPLLAAASASMLCMWPWVSWPWCWCWARRCTLPLLPGAWTRASWPWAEAVLRTYFS